MVEPLSLLLHPRQHLGRAVDSGSFFVAGDEKADRAVELAAARLDVIERRRGEAGNRALHVRGAPAIEHPVADLGSKGRVAPQRGIARWDDIDMAREAKMRRPLAETRIEIVHRRGVL